MRRAAFSHGSILRNIALGSARSCTTSPGRLQFMVPRSATSVIIGSDIALRHQHTQAPSTLGSCLTSSFLNHHPKHLTSPSPALDCCITNSGARRPFLLHGSSLPPLRSRGLNLGSITTTRRFHSTPTRHDVFFLAFPALKASLLSLTRLFLVALPFVYRYR